jgi:hypothetical protein
LLALAVYRLNRVLRSKFSTRVSLLRVLPFSPRNQRNANPRKYWRVRGIFFATFTNFFCFFRLSL